MTESDCQHAITLSERRLPVGSRAALASTWQTCIDESNSAENADAASENDEHDDKQYGGMDREGFQLQQKLADYRKMIKAVQISHACVDKSDDGPAAGIGEDLSNVSSDSFPSTLTNLITRFMKHQSEKFSTLNPQHDSDGKVESESFGEDFRDKVTARQNSQNGVHLLVDDSSVTSWTEYFLF